MPLPSIGWVTQLAFIVARRFKHGASQRDVPDNSVSPPRSLPTRQLKSSARKPKSWATPVSLTSSMTCRVSAVA